MKGGSVVGVPVCVSASPCRSCYGPCRSWCGVCRKGGGVFDERRAFGMCPPLYGVLLFVVCCLRITHVVMVVHVLSCLVVLCCGLWNGGGCVVMSVFGLVSPLALFPSFLYCVLSVIVQCGSGVLCAGK